MDKISKLILPVAILTASIVLGGFFYASQVNKQKSIEKQQILKQMEDRRIEDEKLAQEKKEYIVKRKKDCYDLETSERKKFNNVDGSFYDEENDVCKIKYVNEKWREGDPNSCGSIENLKKASIEKLEKSTGYKSIFGTCTIEHYFTKDF